MSTTTARAGIVGLALGLTASLGLVPAGVPAKDLPQGSLMASDRSGVPDGFTSEQWQAARGEAEVVTQEDGQDVIEFEASGLVPEGLYTLWWVNEGTFGMDTHDFGGERWPSAGERGLQLDVRRGFKAQVRRRTPLGEDRSRSGGRDHQ